MRNILTTLICLISTIAFGQPSDLDAKSSKKQDEMIINWLKDLNQKGIEWSADSLKFSKEFQKVMQDQGYRNAIYPKVYTWEQTVQFIQVQELKKAFWFFINLYPENATNKELVIKSIVAYDQLFKMDELMVNAFYTYCFMDPEVSKITDGKPEITRPDILEAKLRDVKEIVGYILYNRKKREETVK